MKEEEFMKKVRKEFIELVEKEKVITLENIPKRMNSYEWNYLMQHWDNETLLDNVKYYIKQSFNEFRKTPFVVIDGTYNKTLKQKLIHMLAERLELEINKNICTHPMKDEIDDFCSYYYKNEIDKKRYEKDKSEKRKLD